MSEAQQTHAAPAPANKAHKVLDDRSMCSWPQAKQCILVLTTHSGRPFDDIFWRAGLALRMCASRGWHDLPQLG
eukprot:1665080-Pleurochrysis_carterae.AAC.1